MAEEAEVRNAERDGETRRLIQATLSDLVASFLHYDRKEDEELPYGVIEAAVMDGVFTEDQIIAYFRQELINGLGLGDA